MGSDKFGSPHSVAITHDGRDSDVSNAFDCKPRRGGPYLQRRALYPRERLSPMRL